MKLILLGPAGSGKGSFAKKITVDFGIPQISIGELLRQVALSGTPIGGKVGFYQRQGILVPDEITFDVLKKRLSKKDCINGFILDGFPRSLSQAQLLEKITTVDAVIKIDVPYSALESRLVSRRQCPKCGEIDNTQQFGYTGKCRKCSTKLFQRDDDKPEAIKVRLEAYKQNISPLVCFYGDKVHEFSNESSLEESYAPVKAFLQKLEAKK